MLNNPPPGKPRRPHPLEQGPMPPPQEPGGPDEPQNQRVMLHIPVVRPYVVYALIAINVLIFFLAFYAFSDIQRLQLYNWGANNQRAVLEFGEYYRLLTAMFLHGSLVHILFNMYALWIIGQTVEGLFGHVRFVLIYFLGGLAGSILSVMLNPAGVTSVGASGAVFAIFGAEMIYLYEHRTLLGAIGRAQLRQLLMIAGINFAYGILTTFSPGGVRIDNWGHVGGFIGGLIMARLIGPIFIVRQHPQVRGALTADDINPLHRRQQPVLIYVSALLTLLILATLLAR
jgi:rhomboid protease GluP